ncbi:hypothetical protein BST86_14620 [Nonlabens agnitus]|uniref:DUF7507 domain-containing protein n=1 Tax=Nonlabens agnitus TaxID=870484 RepID=A0A2S9WXN3_9FLAO|nr:DUF11 domain-containing protein [Nonlabens agnitus]PRP68229.1 hypothetical protein BST86_14620 [Nonlabens agnitus]
MGETISYSFTVTNTGATTLTDITITDPLLVAPNGSLLAALSRALHLERWTRRPLAEATRSSSPTLMRNGNQTRHLPRERIRMVTM